MQKLEGIHHDWPHAKVGPWKDAGILNGEDVRAYIEYWVKNNWHAVRVSRLKRDIIGGSRPLYRVELALCVNKSILPEEY